MSRKKIKVSFTLAKVVCGFHSRLDQCRDRNFSFYLQHCYRLPHAAASNAASVNGPLKCNFNFNFPYFKFKVPAKFYLLLFYFPLKWSINLKKVENISFVFRLSKKIFFLQKNESKLFGKQNTKNKEINLNFQKDVEKTSK